MGCGCLDVENAPDFVDLVTATASIDSSLHQCERCTSGVRDVDTNLNFGRSLNLGLSPEGIEIGGLGPLALAHNKECALRFSGVDPSLEAALA